MDDNNDVIVITRNETKRQTSLSVSQIKLLEKKGRFPRAVRLGPWRVGYIQSEVTKWIRDRVAARDANSDGDLQGVMTRQLRRARAARPPTPIAAATAARKARRRTEQGQEAHPDGKHGDAED